MGPTTEGSPAGEPERPPGGPDPDLPPEECCLETGFTSAGLPRLRVLTGAYAAHLGLAGRGREALLLSANEVADNAIRHAGGGGRLALYRDGPLVCCRVCDDGPGFDPSVVPERAPGLGSPTGWGLWTVRQLTDGLEIGRGDGDRSRGAVVTFWVRLTRSVR
ncbi:ATP-binding protein [Streptomyces albofaciens JCM 4342]|uniref:ATP-binding protein n=1 Tax=Streptomyces albofaciens TaxID=66866 RepID=UPI00123AA2CC|nr:ATP-binding protein [Streptomyces albofaciens]KAA6214634.1 ATP-binding protein [Streptomyces albofaciens JCM 4342]